MVLLAHHAKTYLGIEIDINGRETPDGMVDHVLSLRGLPARSSLYGLYALVRDLWRYGPRNHAEARPPSART